MTLPDDASVDFKIALFGGQYGFSRRDTGILLRTVALVYTLW